MGYNNGAVTGYSTGKVTGAMGVGGLVGHYAIGLDSIIGYARGEVVRRYGAQTTLGLLLGINKASTTTIVGYLQTRVSLVNITAAVRSGLDGDEITVNDPQSAFVGFTFGDKPSQWTFTVGRWPSINLEALL